MKRKFNLHDSQSSSLSRRSFLQNSSVAFLGAAAVSGLPFIVTSHAEPDEPIRIGLIGCGGRGTGARNRTELSDAPGMDFACASKALILPM